MEIGAYKALADKFKDHKNLLRIYKIYRTKNSLYMIMELCKGGDLEGKMKNGRKVPEREAIKLLKATVSALAFMNQHNVFHRDIKPANIIINDGIYKICDYGLAKVVGHNNKSFTLLGTPLYQAPEIWYQQNQPKYFQKGYGPNIDIFSTGVMVFEAMYGKTPWNSNNAQLLQQDMKRQGTIKNWPRYPSVSAQMKKILTLMCMCDPAKRPTAKQL